MPYTDFGWALTALRQGAKIARRGWNGVGMYVVLQKGYPAGIPINGNTSSATGIPEGTICVFKPYLMLRTTDGAFVPWAPSVSDCLAEDWMIVESEVVNAA